MVPDLIDARVAPYVAAHITRQAGWVSEWWMVEGLDCEISIELRPVYCDRGDYIAKIHLKDGGDVLRLGLDNQDGWPRYYFGWERMLCEIEAWLAKRGQMIEEVV